MPSEVAGVDSIKGLGVKIESHHKLNISMESSEIHEWT